jgi:hypothetical protein
MRDTSENAAYMQKWRKTPEGKTSMRRQRLRREARMAAYRKLEVMHYRDFLTLFNAELRDRGVTSSD